MLEGNIDFVNAFAGLNPYDLAYFTQILHVQFEDVIANRGIEEKLPLTQQDIKHALICTMRIWKIELTENQLRDTRRDTHTVQRLK